VVTPLNNHENTSEETKMKIKMRYAIPTLCLIFLTVLLFLAACTGQTGPSGMVVGSQKDTEPIVLGYIGPLTGDTAFYGIEEKNVIEMALDEINQRGGINGNEVRVIYEDGQCTGKEAVTAAHKLINTDKVKIILGGLCSGETLAVAPLAEASKVLLFSSMSTSPDITDAGDFVFRNAHSDTASATATSELAFRNGVRRIGVITENTEYAQGFRKVFVDSFRKLGGEITLAEDYAQSSTDFRTIVTKILATNPDAIMISPQPATGGLVAKQLSEQGYDRPLYGNFQFSQTDILENYGEYVEGLYYNDAAGLNPANPKATAFLRKYVERYGEKPSLDFYSGARYDSMYVLANAIESVGHDTEKIRDYLYNLNKVNGVVGNYRFDRNGDVVGLEFEDWQITNGEAKVVS